MQLSPAAFNAHLRKMGHDLAWRKSYACPCVTPGSGQANPKCTACGGKGRQWAAEVVGRFGVTNQSAKRGQADFGVWEPGDAVLSIGSDCPAYSSARFDRFRSLSSTHAFTDNLRRNYGDKLNGTIVSIDRVFYQTTGFVNVECGIPTVGADGALTWANGAVQPADGVMYSIAGVRYDEWFAYLDLPQNRPMHGGALLPRKLPVRRFDLFGR